MASLTPSGAAAISFTFLRGLVEGSKLELEPITRPGVDGVAVRELGNRGEIFDLIGVVDCDDLAAAKTKLESLEAVQGTVGNSVVDDFGTTTTGLILWKVRAIEKKKLITASGGISTSKGALLVVALTLQKSS